jgi:hypothetical protein
VQFDSRMDLFEYKTQAFRVLKGLMDSFTEEDGEEEFLCPYHPQEISNLPLALLERIRFNLLSLVRKCDECQPLGRARRNPPRY